MKICFATHNENKIEEIRQILPVDFDLIGLDQLGVIEEIPETGKTISENSTQKATFIFYRFKIPVFSDDTGLEVKKLNGAPGVHSARYAGSQRNADDNMNLLLRNLQNINDRSARFKTVITYVDVFGEKVQFVGIVEGEILLEKRGEGGFGYDALFQPIGYDYTFAEMNADEKNEISHRARAFRKLVNYLSAS